MSTATAQIKYGWEKALPATSFEDAVTRVTELLKEEGFGVLTEIDVKTTMKKKLDLDFRKYVILGACNPPLAARALQAEPQIGLMLPCNVVVQEDENNGSIVSIIDPKAMFLFIENDGLKPVAAEAEEKLQRVLNKL
ncbi:MAG: DUF302 domain-containing protein [Calditrichaeota bacterium]|nr:DUF302 domain-containing protein [Calditrichota bacterium]MCB9369485.1 DUF302 domain-containing protein [Calditrichota bacterium]